LKFLRRAIRIRTLAKGIVQRDLAKGNGISQRQRNYNIKSLQRSPCKGKKKGRPTTLKTRVSWREEGEEEFSRGGRFLLFYKVGDKS
jgi:hypothetical protein